jgi:phosphatidylglycerophosphate synthase
LATSTFEKGGTRVFSLRMTLADQLTLVRVLAVPVVIALFLADFHGHYYCATGVSSRR